MKVKGGNMDAAEVIGKAVVVGILVVVMVLVLGVVFAFPVMWLWNWLMPTIFGVKTITLWQAWGILVLSGMLFKSSSVSSKQ